MLTSLYARKFALLVVLLTVIIAAAITLRPEPQPLPPRLAGAVVTHQVRSAVDSVRVAQLEQQAAADSARAANWRLAAIEATRAAERVDRRADSLAQEAARAATARDSAAGWQRAYEARTAERDTLAVALHATADALDAATARGDTLARALVVRTAQQQRADSLVRALVAQATRPSCRVLGLVRCPTRMKSAVAGAVVGAVAVGVLARAPR